MAEAALAQPWQEAQPPLAAIPTVPGWEGSTVSQGSSGSPRLTAKPQACPALWLGWGGGTGEAPPRHSPQPPALPSCSPPGAGRRRHYLIPTEEWELPTRGRETPTPTHAAPPDLTPLGQPAAAPWVPLPGHSAGDVPCPRHGSTSAPCQEAEAALPSRQGCTAKGEQGPEHRMQLPGTDRQTDRRGQAAAIPAPPARKNSRRLDLDQVFPQVLFDMNIKGASQIPSAVRGLKNPCR